MKLARDIFGWPRFETSRFHIEIFPSWYWSPGPHLDADDFPLMWHCFFGWLSVTWIER